ncbi:hypothetical protein [Mycobacteroides abscessus]|uniref:hypothetical protein n=1 Tax=Mycobacteroides abscessus TaxID=36809 RepID=UPI000C2628F6|nr:hypothetical protein [Mycobacteroides abscessus]MDB2213840.1 hypothetical protein [Mycobacteroides abscessus subsp. massiliense]WJJ55543.1 hypothetical protein PROPHIT492_16 [Mycobacterium phage prophiT49-2]
MTDPAVEAAQRAEDENTGRIPPFEWDDALDGAIQALRPIREWHQKQSQRLADRYSSEALMLKAQLAEIAPLIFTTEEINQ